MTTCKHGFERYLFHRNYLFTLAFIVLGILWWCRGSYVMGWETLGPAKAKLDIDEQGIWRACSLFGARRASSFTGTLRTVSFSVTAGSADLYEPESLLGAMRAIRSRGIFCTRRAESRFWLFFAACLSSLPLIAFSIVGYPYLSGFFPYAVAFMLVFSAHDHFGRFGRFVGFRSTALLTFGFEPLAWTAVCELAMHCYELGKTSFLIPLFAVLAVPGVTRTRRSLWVIVASARCSFCGAVR